MKICIGRLGYVGLPLAIQFAHAGAHAIGLNIEKSAEWNRGAVARFDLVLIGTNHEFAELSRAGGLADCIVDTRNAMASIPTSKAKIWKA
jgi:UDP-N-acetyl-D-mannosaminuronate dehydrogenase